MGILDAKVYEGNQKDHSGPLQTEIVGSIINGKLVQIDLKNPSTIPGTNSDKHTDFSKKSAKVVNKVRAHPASNKQFVGSIVNGELVQIDLS